MIKSLVVQDYALIENEQIQFENGFNVITGETGAGKSILISAINFVLGDRADKSKVRIGCDYARVEVQFETQNNEVLDSLSELGFEQENLIIINRKLYADGKSEIRLNGNIVTLSMLKKVTKHLVDIYGQHEHQALLDSTRHIEFLDKYLGENIKSQKDKLRKFLEEKTAIQDKINCLGGDEASREREKDILEYQVKELEEANLVENEEQDLIIKKSKMQNFQRVYDAIKIAREGLTEMVSGSACDNIYNAKKLISGLSNIDSEFDNIADRLESLEIEARDISDTLEQKIDEFYFDEYEFSNIDARLDLIKSFKRKYGNSVAEMLDYLEKNKNRLLELEYSNETLNKLTVELQEVKNNIERVCFDITDIRKKGAINFENQILKELKQLGMPNAQFIVNFENAEPSINGADKVEFQFSANVGQPLKPLTKVISGGEMSRFMLAFKIAIGNIETVDTMIFDEIDNGISGIVSLSVGEKMAVLAKNSQIIAITHLATIASYANAHYQIYKEIKGSETISNIIKLNENSQLQEISRLAGGSLNSQIGLEHAQELKEKAFAFISGLK